MLKKIISNNLSLIFNFTLITIFLSSLFIYYKFNNLSQYTNYKSFEIHLIKVNNIAQKIEKKFNILFPDFNYKELLKDGKKQDSLNTFLQSFNSTNHKNILLLERPQKESISYRVLSNDLSFNLDKFGEYYEPLSEEWKIILSTLKPVYFKKGVVGIWFTYQYPIIHKNRLVAIISIDFSVENYNHIKQYLKKIDNVITEYIYFILFCILLLSLLSLINRTITKDNKILLNNLSKKTYELENLNETLEGAIFQRTNELENYINVIDKNVIISTIDLAGKITNASESFCKISGYSKDELLGMEHKELITEDMRDRVFNEIKDVVSNKKDWKGELKNIKKNGEIYWVNATVSPSFNQSGKIIGYTAIRHDITDKKIIEHLSITDALTDIFNRRYFNEVLPKVINSAKRKNEKVGLMIIDVDNFKQYNDTYGHQKGDNVLKTIGKILKNSLNRADDYCFRLGGEEFGIIFKNDKIDLSIKFANKLRSDIEELKIEHKNSTSSKFLTISIGLVLKDAKDIEDDDSIFKEADDLLYKAKNNGRNRVVCNCK